MSNNISRRDFMKVIALGSVGATLAACAQKVVKETVEVQTTVEVPKTVKETVEVVNTVVVPQTVKETVEVVQTQEVKQTVIVETIKGGLPVPRDQAAIINETTVFRVFDMCNPFTPGSELGDGWDQLCGARLMYLNWATGESINMLVEGYEYNTDFTQLTFHVRKGVMWNDGQPFTAKDIKFTIEMLKSNANLGYSSTMIQWVDKVETPDDYTAVFTLTSANSRFHWNFKQAWSTPIVAQHEWAGKDPMTYKAFPPIGTGPYKWSTAIPELRMIVWEKVDNWWGTSVLNYDPGPKYIIRQTSPPPEAEIQDLADNFIDHAHSYTSDANLLHRSQDLNKEVVLAPWRDPCPRGLWFNCAKYPLSKPEVRWAMFHCVDKKKAADKLYPWPTVPADYPWADWGGNAKYDYKDILDKYGAGWEVSFDIAKANKILDDLGFKAGSDGIRVDDKAKKMEFTIIVPQVGVTGEYPIALDWADNLKKAGISATVKWMDMTPWDEALSTGQFDISSHWWCGNWQEPPLVFDTWQSQRIQPIGTRDTAGNWIRLDDATMTELGKKLDDTSPDDPAIQDLYKQAFEQFIKLMVSIPVIQTTFVMPFNTHYWKGWPQEGNIKSVPFPWWPEFQFVLFDVKKA
jgi:peptide/nickel transport system substrate-binding protein